MRAGSPLAVEGEFVCTYSSPFPFPAPAPTETANGKPARRLEVVLVRLAPAWINRDLADCLTAYRFKPNSSGCGDGVIRMNVLPNSKIHVICPSTVTVLDTVQSSKPKHELHENLWIAFDNQSFELCDTNASNAGQPPQPESRLLMRCDKPLELKYYTLVFQEFSPAAGGLEFKPGKEYYFLGNGEFSRVIRKGLNRKANTAVPFHESGRHTCASARFFVYLILAASL